MNARAENTVHELEVLIVGAGFGGIGAAIKLLESGEDRILILEKADEVGGTWRENTYPGCACDVQSHLYSYSFAGKADWTKRFAPWDEIQSYIVDCTEKYGLRRYIAHGEEVLSAEYDEALARWTVKTRSGSQYRARFFIMGTGPLHIPNKPAFPGMEKFKGKIFHSAEWEHDYPLEGKRVVSIGTGASAIQYIPSIAPRVSHLTVIQRSPAWVIPRDERAYSALTKTAFEKLPLLRKAYRASLYLRNEARLLPIFNARLAEGLQQLAKLFLFVQVRDPETRRKLTPDYTIGCKRVLISNEYYPTFNRENVDLVTDKIREFRENSIVMESGKEIPADCVILGTGFLTDPRSYLGNFEIRGRDGLLLLDAWRDLPEAYLGITVPRFPNMFQLIGPNSGLGHNSMIFMIEAQVHYILRAIEAMRARGADSVEISEAATKRFGKEVEEALKGTVWASGCVSWYQEAGGGRNIAIWPYSTIRYWWRTRRINPADHIFSKASVRTPVEAAAAVS